MVEPQSATFEESLRIVEEVVERLERADLPLEEALQLLEEGVKHLRNCEVKLSQAKRRVTLLLAEGEEPFPEGETP